MLEVLARHGLGRTAAWTVSGRTVQTPAILFAVTSRHPAPPFGDLLLSDHELHDPRPTFLDRGSIFRPRARESTTSIPPDGARSSVLPDLVRPGSESGPVVVAAKGEDLAASPEAEVVCLGDAIAFLRRPKEFVAVVSNLRRSMGYARLLYVPGLAVPGNLPILAYCSVDLVDSTRILFESTMGRFHRSDGVWASEDVDPSSCACPACAGTAAGKDPEGHNTRALFDESRHVSMAIRGGRLRELVERRAANDAWSTAVLREMDLRFASWQEVHAPVAGGPLLAYTAQSLTRPEVLRFVGRVTELYAKPPSARILVLLPCSARKPYADSKTHRRFREAVWASGNPHAIHEVILTSPFGVVPRELERAYPVANYDVPVTGDWSRDEVAVVTDGLRTLLTQNAYDAVIAHVVTEAPFVAEVTPDAVFTAKGKTTEEDSLAALTAALRESLRDTPRVGAHFRLREDLRNLAVFQFGPDGGVLTDGASFRGRYPNVKVFQDGRQVGMFTERGKLSVTLDGGALLSSRDVHAVEIEDFFPEGSVFSVGVTGADERIRIGDEVVVRHGKEVRAVGVAAMNPREMVDLERGEAVKVRHRIKKAL